MYNDEHVNMSIASKTVSRVVINSTRAYSMKTDDELKANQSTQSDFDSEELRNAYLSMIDSPTWKKQIEDSATCIASNLVKDFPKNDTNNDQFSIAYNNIIYEFNASVNKFVLIGLKHGCDIQLKNQKHVYVSRVHAIIMPFPQFGIYLVVDMGGLFGIGTQKRSTDKPCVSSRMNNRNILIFDWDEISVCCLGTEKIVINSKGCIICFERPRTKTFNCGHYVTCDVCTQTIDECPYCRIPIKNIRDGIMLKTFESSIDKSTL